jgi:tetratricopeptide (TPR) repeat protein
VSSDANDVIYELGGNATTEKPAGQKLGQDSNGEEASPIARSEDLKAQGNEEFKNKNFLEALDLYGLAIEATPGMAGSELLQMRDEFDERERAKIYERNRLDNEERRRRQAPVEQGRDGEKSESETSKEQLPPPEQFKAPPHPHGEKLSVYHNNRAACKLHLSYYDDAIKDCDIAILLNPAYAKAYVRRSLAHEKTEKTELALADAKQALECDPQNATIRKTAARLQKIEDERLEKLKEETLGKLKDLGNSLLGNFGLSLDNFKTVQDPNGSYSIQFDNSTK